MRHPLGRDTHHAHIYKHHGKAERYLDNHFNMIWSVVERARVGEGSASAAGSIGVSIISPQAACRTIRRARERISNVIPTSSKIG
jgi:hypothetical protein